MKSVVNVEAFREALKKAFSACAKRSDIPGFLNVCISFSGDACKVTGTNIEHWCQVTIPASGDAFTFRFQDTKRAMAILKHYSGDMSVEMTGDEPFDRHGNGTLTLRCGGRDCTQEVAEADYFYDLPEIPNAKIYQVNADALFQRYKRIRYALASSTTCPTFQCVQFLDNRMIAVDGYRLAVSQDEAFRIEGRFYVPPGAMDLLPIFGDTDCSVQVGERHIAFVCDEARIVFRAPAGEGLNVDAAVPKTSQEEHVMDVDTLIRDVQYLNEFVTRPERQAVRIAERSMSLSTPVGKCSVTLELREPLQTICGVNARYMLDGLKQFKAKKTQTITMGLSSPKAPILLTDGDGDLAMILPMRLEDAASAA